ncbi:unnamed protein product [Alopecurus aequalis]
MAGSFRFWRSANPAAIDFNDEGILNNITETNLKNIWASRRMVEDGDRLYLVHFQRTAGIGLPITVVVKKFQNLDGIVDADVESRWKLEMIMLAFVHHENIIKVLHAIQREDTFMLVYEYPLNGSLDYWLHRREEHDMPLSWRQRRAIAIGVAQGLCHMHYGCNKTVVHHNINCNNILLDQELDAKISSFEVGQMDMAGLNQPLPIVAQHVGYTAPEYFRVAELMEKVDSYSFGVVLLELVTGRVANGDDGLLAVWARNNCNELMANKHEGFKEVVDMGIPHRARYMKEMLSVFKLGVACTVVDPQERPSMLTVLGKLRRPCGLFGGLLYCIVSK